MYVVTNSEVYHLADTNDDGKAICGFAFNSDSASVVTQRPEVGFRPCGRCEGR